MNEDNSPPTLATSLEAFDAEMQLLLRSQKDFLNKRNDFVEKGFDLFRIRLFRFRWNFYNDRSFIYELFKAGHGPEFSKSIIRQLEENVSTKQGESSHLNHVQAGWRSRCTS